MREAREKRKDEVSGEMEKVYDGRKYMRGVRKLKECEGEDREV